MNVPSPISLYPEDIQSPEQFADLPACAGVYRLEPLQGESHISWSRNLQRRAKRLLQTFGQTIRQVDCWPAPSRLATSLLLYGITKQQFPHDYATRLRIRSPWFLSLSFADAFPQLIIANRIREQSPFVLGPFRTRDLAQYFEQKVLGLFQLRQCPGLLSPSAEHPGCIYGEMNQCLRPCQCAVSADEYASEVKRATDFLITPRSTLASLSTARDRASEDMDFELASQIHRRIEKVKEAMASRETSIAEISSFNGIALTRGHADQSCCLHPMLNARWQEPFTISFVHAEGQSQSLDAVVRERVTSALGTASYAGDRTEHLALFQRWYGSSWRDGEWFPFTTPANLDYRKLVRHMSKIVKESAPTQQ